ncbi:MAG: thioredoxin domain-containing protein [Phycisphaerae bacterium]|nr:thioredoxin domain-containing protein [Phycisphaerae bacterium]
MNSNSTMPVAPVLALVLSTVPVCGASALNDDSPAPEARFTNELVHETSPYLLQHAHNPVDWYPWGDAAFERARAEGKPIFLSIGYSTCYWCHVMERQSFENEQIADLMNSYFVCVKVDREERPDVDDIYMTAVQVMTGQGGWPLSVWLTPDTLEPFFGGTYFPPTDSLGRPGFPRMLESIHQFWTEQRDAVYTQADSVSAKVTEVMSARADAVPIGRSEVDAAISQLVATYDRTHAGFDKKGPKFPMPVLHEFLLTSAWDLSPARQAVTHTLDRMAMGGMYDQVGGGFHRYSTDEQWLVPHFEKMLYDNAMLASVYADAFEKTGDAWYGAVAAETLDWVLREMTSPDGAFYSALDAESNAREGESYLWTPEEIRSSLEAAGLGEEVEFTLEVYGLNKGTNFQDPHHPAEAPSNVLFLSEKPEDTAKRLGMSGKDLHRKWQAVNAALLATRDRRDQPGLDDKVITGWNGLMIGGMADAGRILQEQRYVEAATKAADDVMSSMWTRQGGLLRTRRGDDARINAFLEDYAYMIRGLLRLEQATGDSRYLDQAATLAQQARERFWNESGGGWYETLADQEDLFVRGRSFYDGAMPSANAVMINNMIELYERTGRKNWGEDAVAALDAVSADIVQAPRSAIHSVQGLHRLERSHPTLLGKGGGGATKKPGSHVALSSADRQVRLAVGESATVTLVLEIDKGWHVNAHVQQDEFNVALEIMSLTPGLQVQAAYPHGHAFNGPDGPVNVYEGRVEIPITLTRTGDIGRSGRMSITWQSCNDRTCLMPRTEQVPIKVLPPLGS